jgi:hypothetical protein
MTEKPVRMSMVTIPAAAVVLAAALAACGSEPPAPGAAPTATATASGEAAAPREEIPPSFDNTRGWLVEESPDGTGFGRPALAPRTDLLLLRTARRDSTSRIVARDAKTGAGRWSSRPVPLLEGKTDVMVFVAARDGKEYAVLTNTGAGKDDGLNDPVRSTHLFVYDTASTGDDVAPLRDIRIPGEADHQFVQADGFAVVRSGTTVAVADIVTGQVTSYPGAGAATKAPEACGSDCNLLSKVVAVTPRGPLVQGFGAFWTPNGWYSGSSVPAGAGGLVGERKVKVAGSPDGQAVLAAWPIKDDTSTDRIWAVHDGRTGQVQAVTTCYYPNTDDLEPTLSADGRYLFAGSVVFDLTAKKGICLGATGTRRAITLTGIDKNGTGYGTASRAVTVTLATGEAAPLSETAQAPDIVAGDVAIFGRDTAGGANILVYPHR